MLRSDLHLLCTALCVWNAKTSGGGNGTATLESQNRKPEVGTATVQRKDRKPEVGTATVESKDRKLEVGTATMETVPVNSFRSFKFNKSAILQAMESGFPA